ncbi:hypothetical protein A4G99_06045 [Haladaptatus sp. R4]|uniref:lactate racemase domain-containing protein n=1 Tax=Haladaptatus sp. R4 TaxID=1679489 RepID=UPI0007B4B1A4|nr:lactate racemase domain-containing protein [Haladaptatus sp. R4]KZN24031.1 hypothetical protein A4G99_06045 [Haladaptatus sp. R4]
MVTLDVPRPTEFENVNDVEIEDLPRVAYATRERDPPQIDDVASATRAAVDDIPALSDLDPGAEVAITVGSRGIHDMPELVEAAVAELADRGYQPFVMPAMGSHGGGTPEGQRSVLAEYGVTEERLGCEIRDAMTVESVAEDETGRPVPVSTVALDADAVLLTNRVKLHTDFHAEVESGVTKMCVVGLGKQRGAEEMHNAAITRGLGTVVAERAALIFEHAPVVGGIALVENARDRAAHIEGVPVGDIPDREPELLERSKELFPGLPVDRLDLLIVDEMGKEVSGTGMDTNVLGRYQFLDEHEPDSPEIRRIYVRTITAASHGNGLGVGLADFVYEDLVERLDLVDTYLNTVTSGEPSRAHIPIVSPSDRTTLLLAYSMTGVRDPKDLRIGYIRNTLEPDELYVSEPVADELRERDDTRVGDLRPLAFDDDGDFAFGFDD